MMRLLTALILTCLVPFAVEAQTVTKEKVTAALPKLRELARQVVAKGEVPGLSIGIVYRDEVVFLEGFGAREAGQPEMVTADTVFQLASVSKPLAMAMVWSASFKAWAMRSAKSVGNHGVSQGTVNK